MPSCVSFTENPADSLCGSLPAGLICSNIDKAVSLSVRKS